MHTGPTRLCTHRLALTSYTQCEYVAGMAIIKKLVQHGNSSALIIEKPILELLNIGPETELDIRTDGRRLIITPIADDVRNAVSSVKKRHGKTLKRLAR